MAEKGIVKSSTKKEVIVSLERNEACAHCGMCSNGLESKEMIIHASNECNAKVGDIVGIELDKQDFIVAVVIMYGIPLVSLFIGIGLGYFIGSLITNEFKELIAIIVGIIFVLATYFLIHLNENKFKKKRYKPRAVKVFKE